MKAFEEYFLVDGKFDDSPQAKIEGLGDLCGDLLDKIKELEGRITELEDRHPYRNLKDGEKILW